jgi:hypothetical protein
MSQRSLKTLPEAAQNYTVFHHHIAAATPPPTILLLRILLLFHIILRTSIPASGISSARTVSSETGVIVGEAGEEAGEEICQT